MKDSGIEWIGEIPEEWEVTEISGLYCARNTKVNDVDYPPLSVTKQGVLPQLENVAKSDDHDNRKLVKKGDFVINSRSDRRGACGISKYDGSVSLINIVLQPLKKSCNSYYNWLFNTIQFSEEFYKWGHGIVDDLWTTTWQDMKKISVPMPPVYFQQHIANYLDKKCSKIDSLTADIQKQIGILEQYRKSVITETVTKGLDPNVKMKDSGIEWIGEIPEEWEVRRLKQCIIGISDGTHGTFQRVSSGKLLLSAKNVFEDGIHINENESMISENDHNLITSNGFPKKNDILLCCVGTVGRCSLYPFEEPIAFQRSVAMLRSNCDVIAYRLLFYCLLSDSVLTQERLITNKSAQEGLYQGAIKELRLCLPKNTDEQILLISYLDSKCSRLDELIRLKNQQLETLAQYKKSLIYEYVTGKREAI